jgi:hypothetical protein
VCMQCGEAMMGLYVCAMWVHVCVRTCCFGLGLHACTCMCVHVRMQDVENELAQFGLLCTVLGMSDEAVSQGHCVATPHSGAHTQHSPAAAALGGSQSELRWIFTGQQMRLSLAQEGLYEDHVSAQVDEDFFGNFS